MVFNCGLKIKYNFMSKEPLEEVKLVDNEPKDRKIREKSIKEPRNKDGNNNNKIMGKLKTELDSCEIKKGKIKRKLEDPDKIEETKICGEIKKGKNKRKLNDPNKIEESKISAKPNTRKNSQLKAINTPNLSKKFLEIIEEKNSLHYLLEKKAFNVKINNKEMELYDLTNEEFQNEYIDKINESIDIETELMKDETTKFEKEYTTSDDEYLFDKEMIDNDKEEYIMQSVNRVVLISKSVEKPDIYVAMVKYKKYVGFYAQQLDIFDNIDLICMIYHANIPGNRTLIMKMLTRKHNIDWTRNNRTMIIKLSRTTANELTSKYAYNLESDVYKPENILKIKKYKNMEYIIFKYNNTDQRCCDRKDFEEKYPDFDLNKYTIEKTKTCLLKANIERNMHKSKEHIRKELIKELKSVQIEQDLCVVLAMEAILGLRFSREVRKKLKQLEFNTQINLIPEFTMMKYKLNYIYTKIMVYDDLISMIGIFLVKAQLYTGENHAMAIINGVIHGIIDEIIIGETTYQIYSFDLIQ